MKHFLFICFFFLLCAISLKAQTFANPPGPENVLVVYKQPIGPTDTLGWVSDSVIQYYITARNIPAVNVVGLPLPDSVEITIGDETHWVGLRQGTDIIRDFYQDGVSKQQHPEETTDDIANISWRNYLS